MTTGTLNISPRDYCALLPDVQLAALQHAVDSEALHRNLRITVYHDRVEYGRERLTTWQFAITFGLGFALGVVSTMAVLL